MRPCTGPVHGNGRRDAPLPHPKMQPLAKWLCLDRMAVPLPTPVLPTRRAFAGYQEHAWVGRLQPINVGERPASEKPMRSDLRPVTSRRY